MEPYHSQLPITNFVVGLCIAILTITVPILIILI